MSNLKPFTSGFMKPPKEHQFKPGQSGNPGGRQKKIETLATITAKILEKKISLKGQSRKITIKHALALRLRELSAKGHRQAIEISKIFEPHSPANLDSNNERRGPQVSRALIAMGFTIVDSKVVPIPDGYLDGEEHGDD